jgi:hypothetical protein
MYYVIIIIYTYIIAILRYGIAIIINADNKDGRNSDDR